MNNAKCPHCFCLCSRVEDAAWVEKKDGDLIPISGWFCENCCRSWFREKKSRSDRHQERVLKKAKYATHQREDEG